MAERPHAMLSRATLCGLWALMGFGLAGCPELQEPGNACPLIAPGGLGVLAPEAFGITLRADTPQGFHDLHPSGIAAHPVALAAGMRLTVSFQIAGVRPAVFAMGPRDGQGGFPFCHGTARGAGLGVTTSVVLDAETLGAGEHLVLVELPAEVSADEVEYFLSVSCSGTCDAAPCPTLAERGCATTRCDGELVRDGSGCLTCACDSGASCEPSRSAGPWGTCVLPACACPDADPAEVVCTTDARTAASRCHAACLGTGVATQGACETACPDLLSCDTPCFGERALDPTTGCPTCECRPTLEPDASSCVPGGACPNRELPVCGTDGVTYRNPCEARCAGAKVLYFAACSDTCREAPEGCDLDCPLGLQLSAEEGGCLSCACQPALPASCVPHGAVMCAQVDALGQWVSMGSPCLARAIDPGLSDDQGVWGPCGQACETDVDCAAGERCVTGGRLAGRCLVALQSDGDTARACGCSGLWDPVCGDDNATYANTCTAVCAGASVAKAGPCCEEAPPSCSGDDVPVLNAHGCPTQDLGCTAPADAQVVCHPDTPLPACAPGGSDVQTNACQAHTYGLAATPGWCQQ